MDLLFVYGTLRPGGANHELLRDAIARQVTATADGLALYANVAGTFPYARVEPRRRLIGTLCWISDTEWFRVRWRLDLLEGYQPQRPEVSHYHRRRWNVEILDGAVAAAWVYLASPRIQLEPQHLVRSGDWLHR